MVIWLSRFRALGWVALFVLVVALPDALHAAPALPRAKSVVIGPKKKAPTKPPTGFQLSKGKGDTLLLSFYSTDRRLRFDSSNPFVIQLNMLGPAQVEPSVITSTEWPHPTTPLTLSVRGMQAGKRWAIAGAAGYNLCGPAPKSCRRTKSVIRYVADK